ncbi:hypothetical protein [Mucilaginibacter celer]|nr:hypothetical protein [Mucilaginibacter celer]
MNLTGIVIFFEAGSKANYYLFLCMQTLEITVPVDKTRLVKSLLKELGVTIKIKKESKIPNEETIAAMNELKAGKGKRFKNVDELFKSI